MEYTEDYLQQVIDLIATNRTSKALKLLGAGSIPEHEHELVILKSRYAQIMEDQRLGTTGDDITHQRINRINLDLLRLIDEVKEENITLSMNAEVSSPGPICELLEKSELEYSFRVIEENDSTELKLEISSSSLLNKTLQIKVDGNIKVSEKLKFWNQLSGETLNKEFILPLNGKKLECEIWLTFPPVWIIINQVTLAFEHKTVFKDRQPFLKWVLKKYLSQK